MTALLNGRTIIFSCSIFEFKCKLLSSGIRDSLIPILLVLFVSDPFTLYCRWLLCGCGVQCSNSGCFRGLVEFLLRLRVVGDWLSSLVVTDWGPHHPDMAQRPTPHCLRLGEFPESAVKCYVKLYCLYLGYVCMQGLS